MPVSAPRPILLLALLGATSAFVDGPAQSPRAKEMKALASELRIESAEGGMASEMVDDPVYRYNDPTRSFSDATLWAFGKSGRPKALLSLSLEGEQSGRWQWLYEFASLAPVKVRAKGLEKAGGPTWAPVEPGIALRPIPGAAAPAGDAAKRLRQMRDLARRFRADERFEPKPGLRPERYELRLLPQPVLRYSDPSSGLIDGAIFLFCYGQNPEIVVLIEARADGAAAPSWSYGTQRLSAAEAQVHLDDDLVAKMPRINDNDMSRPYAGFIRPVPAGKK